MNQKYGGFMKLFPSSNSVNISSMGFNMDLWEHVWFIHVHHPSSMNQQNVWFKGKS